MPLEQMEVWLPCQRSREQRDLDRQEAMVEVWLPCQRSREQRDPDRQEATLESEAQQGNELPDRSLVCSGSPLRVGNERSQATSRAAQQAWHYHERSEEPSWDDVEEEVWPYHERSEEPCQDEVQQMSLPSRPADEQYEMQPLRPLASLLADQQLRLSGSTSSSAVPSTAEAQVSQGSLRMPLRRFRDTWCHQRSEDDEIGSEQTPTPRNLEPNAAAEEVAVNGEGRSHASDLETTEFSLASEDFVHERAVESVDPESNTGSLPSLNENTNELANLRFGSSDQAGCFQEPTQCGICLANFELGEEAQALPCASCSSCPSIFHRECLRPWLRKEGSCPLCRRRFPSLGPLNQMSSSSDDRVPALAALAAYAGLSPTSSSIRAGPWETWLPARELIQRYRAFQDYQTRHGSNGPGTSSNGRLQPSGAAGARRPPPNWRSVELLRRAELP